MTQQQPSLLRVVMFTILRVSSFILTFFFLGGPYFTLLDEMFGAAVGQGNATVTTFSTWVYWSFYYAFPTLMVLGVIMSTVYMVLVLRVRYFASEGAY